MRLAGFAPIALIVTIATVAYLIASAFTVPDMRTYFHEGAGFEEASIGLLLAAIALWFWLAGQYRWREWQIPVVMVLMLARELDFDKRFTHPFGLLKLTTYTHEAPLGVKIVGGIAILFTLWVGLRILRRNVPLWWTRSRQGAGDAWLLTAAFFCGVFAKTFDGLGRKLLGLGIHIPEQVNTLAGQSEEVLEMICYYLIILAIARLAVPAIRREANLPVVAA